MGLQYFKKSTIGSTRSDKDLTITLGKNNKAYVTVRNVFPEDEGKPVYIIPALDTQNHRLYLIEGIKQDGFKLTRSTSNKAIGHFTMIDKEFVKWASNNIGDYDLTWDNNEGGYYTPYGLNYFKKRGGKE